MKRSTHTHCIVYVSAKLFLRLEGEKNYAVYQYFIIIHCMLALLWGVSKVWVCHVQRAMCCFFYHIFVSVECYILTWDPYIYIYTFNFHTCFGFYTNMRLGTVPCKYRHQVSILIFILLRIYL